MRGKAPQFYFSQIVYRITPAYAGKSFLSTSRAFCNQDHPRLCGEKHLKCTRITLSGGSPPPMRGKDVFRGIDENNFRITPAYAGKRTQSQS